MSNSGAVRWITTAIMTNIHFTNADLQQFSMISHDVNPLHMSDDYARRTPFGERVVFGVLAALATVQYTPARPAMKLKQVGLLFMNPVFVDTTYRVEVATHGVKDQVQVFDGRRRILQATFTYDEMAPAEADTMPLFDGHQCEAHASRQVAAERNDAELAEGFHAQGHYMPPMTDLETFIQRWQLTDHGISLTDVIALIWSSYAVGMELPGKQAAFSRLEMTLHPLSAKSALPFVYHIDLTKKDERFDLLQIQANLLAGEASLAEAQIWATMRAASRKSSVSKLEVFLPESERLRGRVALVIGGSRGLGASMVQALAMQGCTVLLNYARSHEEARFVRNELPASAGAVHLLPGDATDIAWCQARRAEILTEYHGLDYLVCNASPPIRPMDFAVESLDRFYAFINNSMKLVATPMALFSDLLKNKNGRYVVISSVYARTTPPDFPHYVAAKCAIEGLLQATCPPNRFPSGVLVRPPKLWTDQTNTAIGKRDTLLPEQIAATVVSELMGESHTDGLRIIEDFIGAQRG